MTDDLNTTFRASPFYKKVGARMLSQTTHLRRIFPLIFHTASTLSAPSGHLLPKEGGSIHASPFPWKGLLSAARRGWLPFLRRSGALVYRLLETIPLALFHAASALSAPSGHLPHAGKAVCRGYRFPLPTSAPTGHLLPKEGGSIHASPFPWKGLPSAARRGWLPFWATLGCSCIMAHLRRSPPSFIPPEPYPARSARHLPHAGKVDRAAVNRVLSLIVNLRCISSLSFIPLSPSNLRPFGAPPSIGRRQCPREPLPLEGAAKRSEAGLASFFGGEAASSLPSPLRKALPGNRYSRFFIHPTQKRPSLTSGRFYVYYLLRETLIKSQNSI